MAVGKGPTLVYALITVLGIAACGLSIAGEGRRNAGSVITDVVSDESYCVYEPDDAHGLAVGACSLLLCSQVVVMVATSCLCCGSRLASGMSRACTVVFFILSWISFVIAEAFLIAAAKDNWYDDRYGNDNYSKGISCSTLRKALFVAGAIFIVSTTILNVFYYMCFTQASRKHIDQQADYPARSTVATSPSG